MRHYPLQEETLYSQPFQCHPAGVAAALLWHMEPGSQCQLPVSMQLAPSGPLGAASLCPWVSPAQYCSKSLGQLWRWSMRSGLPAVRSAEIKFQQGLFLAMLLQSSQFALESLSFLTFIMEMNWERGRLANKMLVMQAPGPEFDPQLPCRKPSMIVPTAAETEAEV